MTKKFETVEDEFRELLYQFKLPSSGALLYSVCEIWKKNIHNLYFPPVIEEALRECRKSLKVALLTNTDAFPFEFVKLRYGIEKYFDFVVASYDIQSVKPDTKMFIVALEKLGLKPEEVVMCGDNPFNDIIPAKQLGMKTMLIDTKRIFSDFTGADYTVSTIKDFTDKLKDMAYIGYQNKFIAGV